MFHGACLGFEQYYPDRVVFIPVIDSVFEFIFFRILIFIIILETFHLFIFWGRRAGRGPLSNKPNFGNEEMTLEMPSLTLEMW